MAPILTPVNHIRLDQAGQAWIEGTNFKVLEIVLDYLAHGWSPEEIYFQRHEQISLAQIHAALSYYYDHKAELDSEIKRQVKEVGALRATAGESPFRKRMRREGVLP